LKYVDEFRDPRAARALVREILGCSSRRWRIMEICGGQTHTLVRSGIDRLLERCVDLVHGPGCPVCVTPPGKIDLALELAGEPGLVLASFGDMMRVPGSRGDLLQARAAGADVRLVESPLEALRFAEESPRVEVVFFAIGFETTAPATAMALRLARERRVGNFSVLCAHVLVPPAIRALAGRPGTRLDGFLAPGHVCSITGCAEYEMLAGEVRAPFVVAGFEPLDLLQALRMLVESLERGECGLRNQYTRAVRSEGNPEARRAVDQVFRPCDAEWRGLGPISGGGLRLRGAYRRHDAEQRFPRSVPPSRESERCIAGAILQGLKKPADCPAFGAACTPEQPLGAPMVSSEGACAAHHAYRRGTGRDGCGTKD
jgi:hydrogenase expression/formation protein HypD